MSGLMMRWTRHVYTLIQGGTRAGKRASVCRRAQGATPDLQGPPGLRGGSSCRTVLYANAVIIG